MHHPKWCFARSPCSLQNVDRALVAAAHARGASGRRGAAVARLRASARRRSADHAIQVRAWTQAARFAWRRWCEAAHRWRTVGHWRCFRPIFTALCRLQCHQERCRHLCKAMEHGRRCSLLWVLSKLQTGASQAWKRTRLRKAGDMMRASRLLHGWRQHAIEVSLASAVAIAGRSAGRASSVFRGWHRWMAFRDAIHKVRAEQLCEQQRSCSVIAWRKLRRWHRLSRRRALRALVESMVRRRIHRALWRWSRVACVSLQRRALWRPRIRALQYGRCSIHLFRLGLTCLHVVLCLLMRAACMLPCACTLRDRVVAIHFGLWCTSSWQHFGSSATTLGSAHSVSSTRPLSRVVK